jgi:hypothetical protein
MTKAEFKNFKWVKGWCKNEVKNHWLNSELDLVNGWMDGWEKKLV